MPVPGLLNCVSGREVVKQRGRGYGFGAMKTSLIQTLILTFMLAVSSASATVLLNDTFSNGLIGPQNLPTSAQWYGSNTTLTAETGAMTLGTSNGTAMVTGYFTDSGTVSLTEGMSITLSFSFTLTGANSTSGFFRFGLFDSGGNRLTAQDQGAANSLFNYYTGYATLTDINTTTNRNIGLGMRNNLPNNGLLNSVTPYTTFGSSGAPFTLQNDTQYTSTFTLTNTGSGIEITQTFTGGSLSGITRTQTDSSTTYTTFDTAAIIIQGSAASTITFSQISVTMIPEPSTAILLGAALVGVGILRKTQRKV